jgi:hypothetical protein
MQSQLILILSSLALTILGGIGLLLLVRWARRHNENLVRQGKIDQKQAVADAVTEKPLSKLIIAHFTGTIPREQAIVGKALSIIIILFLLAFFFFAALAIIKKCS